MPCVKNSLAVDQDRAIARRETAINVLERGRAARRMAVEIPRQNVFAVRLLERSGLLQQSCQSEVDLSEFRLPLDQATVALDALLWIDRLERPRFLNHAAKKISFGAGFGKAEPSGWARSRRHWREE